MPYIGTQPKDVRSFGKVQFDFTATQGQTAFTGADDDGKTLGFTEGQIQVYVNGILMDASDYTTSNTNTVTLASAANLNDIITVVALQTDIPNSDYVPISGGTFTGDVTADGDVTLNPTGGVTVSRGSGHSNNYEGGRITLKNGINYTKQYGIDTYFENLRIFREDDDGTNGVVRFEIDSAGRVTMQNQPSFIAHKSNSSSVNGVLSWTTLHQTGNHFNGTRFTAPVTGRYHFDFGGITHNVTNYFYIGFRINGTSGNGTQQGATWRHLPQTTAAYNNMHTSAVLHLNANDYVEAATGLNGGSPYLEQYRSSFSGYLIG